MTHPLVDTWLADAHPSWLPTLNSVRSELERASVAVEQARAAGASVLPADERVLRALEQPVDAIRVLIVGQDPYPTSGHAVGLAFSVAPEVLPLPASLRNIFRELVDDLMMAGVPTVAPVTGDLSPWTQRGVMLLNRVLTVRAGEAGSMRRVGWEAVTLAVVRTLARRAQPPVAILWGADAGALADEFDEGSCIVSAHPSPLAAYRGFFGSRPFTRANHLLVARGLEPVDWSLSA